MRRTLSYVLAGALAAQPLVAGAQDPNTFRLPGEDDYYTPPATANQAPYSGQEDLAQPPSGITPPSEVTPPANPPAPPTTVPTNQHTVYLGSDGNLAGRLGFLGPQGTKMPVRGTIEFIQNGQRVTTAESDERGMFQALGLRPGIYSVVATSEQGSAVFGLEVLPFDPNAPVDLLLLDVVVAPVDDLALGDELLGEQLMPLGMPAGGFAGGGFGGGGGGFGGLGTLLGAAGLGAGIAALASDDDDDEPVVVSPFLP